MTGLLSKVTHDGVAGSDLNLSYIFHPDANGGKVPLANESDGSGHSTGIGWGYRPSPGAAERIGVTNSQGGTTFYDFDKQGNVVKATPPLMAGQSAPHNNSPAVTATYDGNFNLLSASDGKTSASYGYADNGLLTSAQDSAGNQSTFTYNGADILTLQDPRQKSLNVQDSVGYSAGNLSHIPDETTDALGNTWMFDLNGYGQTTKITPPSGSPLHPANIGYDEVITNGVPSPSYGWPISTTDGNGNQTTIDAYDLLGDPLAVSTYLNGTNTSETHTTTFSYDAAQRLTSLTHPFDSAVNAARTFQNFYVGDHLDHTIDEAGTQFDFNYCAACGALTDVLGPSIGTTQWAEHFALDGDHRVTIFSDALGHQTNYVYGAAGELTSVYLPDKTADNPSGRIWYNNQGQVSKVTNGRGHDITFGYDNLERLQTITFPTSHDPTITYTYNVDDSLQSVTDGTGTTTFSYLANGWLASVVYNYGASGLSAPQELDYTYWPDGARRTLTWQNGSATVRTWYYGYDAGGRWTRLTSSSGDITTWLYDSENKLTSQQSNVQTTTPSGTSTTKTLWASFGYNQVRGWPTSSSQIGWRTVVTPPSAPNGATSTTDIPVSYANYGLTYDGGNNTVGLLTGVTETVAGQNATVQYGYDALYRLTSDTRTGANPYTHQYGLDLAGNVQTLNGAVYGTYDGANKFQTLANGGVDYDLDGNVKEIRGQYALTPIDFTWDDRNRLTSQINNGAGATYGYDASGLRVWSQPQNGSTAGTKTFYVFDGSTLLGEVQSGATGANASVQAIYTWGANGPVSLSPGVGRLYFGFGPSGETRMLANGGANVSATYAYSPYGTPTSTTGSVTNPFRWGGQAGYYTDAATLSNPAGLVLCGQRWYSPFLSRWLSRDPIGYDGGSNLYEYCQSDPVNSLDPFGLADDDLKEYLKGWLKGAANFAYEASPAGEAVRGYINWRTPGLLNATNRAQGFGHTAATIGLNLASLHIPGGIPAKVVGPCEEGGLIAKLIAYVRGQRCFAAGTPVVVAFVDASGQWRETTKPIEQVKPGEWVVSRNEQTEATEYKRVVQTKQRTTPETLAVTTADWTGWQRETVVTTPEHPFFVEGRGFVPAGRLAIGNALVTRAGPARFVTRIEEQSRPEGVAVYNLTIEDDHTYFVGNAGGGLWVHNYGDAWNHFFPRALGNDMRYGHRALTWLNAADHTAFHTQLNAYLRGITKNVGGVVYDMMGCVSNLGQSVYHGTVRA